jgi:hypothetical protein
MIRWKDYVVASVDGGWVWGQTEGNEFCDPGSDIPIVGIEVDGMIGTESDPDWLPTKVFVDARTVRCITPK